STPVLHPPSNGTVARMASIDARRRSEKRIDGRPPAASEAVADIRAPTEQMLHRSNAERFNAANA
ncbi:hypothetical protein, partial [uncultured Sphingomonas sp.]|uniref:hypothetical protein n=1 Tax=uncultured Sphingomonas sp. TaxID=158754 RepID=UPI0026122768